MEKISSLIFLFLLVLSPLQLQAETEQKLSAKIEKVSTSSLPKWSAQFDHLYYDFKGRHPADGNIYGFEGVHYDVRTFSLSHLISPTLSASLQARHITNYAETRFSGILFEDQTQGMGDTRLKLTKTFIDGFDLTIVDIALSAPTGAIDKKNKNIPGNQVNYPYNMQLGSGTWDGELLLMHLKHLGRNQLGAMGMAILRTGQNKFGYRKGNEYISKIWYSFLAKPWFSPGLWLNYHHIQRLSGMDQTYLRNRYVQFYHSPRHFWDLTMNVNSQLQVTKGLKLKGLVGRPIWQESKNIDNVQVYAQWFAQLGLEGQF